MTTTGGDFCEIEREMMGVDHQLLGETLAAHWKFPRSCQLVAGFHHNPATLADQQALSQRSSPFRSVGALADFIVSGRQAQ